MYSRKIAVVSSNLLARSGGIKTVTQTLFRNLFPIFFLEELENPVSQLSAFRTVLFSGFDSQFVDLAKNLKSRGINIAVFWHFSSACEVDADIGSAWRSLLPLLQDKLIDLFITCKKGFENVVSSLFRVHTFFVLNNATDTSFVHLTKKGIGIYSGSSDYWVKNMRVNLYAALMTNLPVDILPFDSTIQSVVKTLPKANNITGLQGLLDHTSFLKRLASRELVSYVTFAEGAPILPLEALNNGVICLTGMNHHYFLTDPRLRSFLTVPFPDDPEAIFLAILEALENKQEILDRYKLWKIQYDKKQMSNLEQLVTRLYSL